MPAAQREVLTSGLWPRVLGYRSAWLPQCWSAQRQWLPGTLWPGIPTRLNESRFLKKQEDLVSQPDR